MSSFTSQPWFWPTLGIVVALPILLLVLTETHNVLARRNSSYARPILMLRNYVLPMGAVLILVAQVERAEVDANWTRIVGTGVGFLLMLFLLSGANAVFFGQARAGSWRERLPTIFIDLGRLVLVLIGSGILLSWVWGADVGALITAVGVTSIVIGLAVQDAVGQVVSGLLLLFEQPFRRGDWLDTAAAKGRVSEVNWRSVHIDTGDGIQIVPNGLLAKESFTNLSRSEHAYQASTTLNFTGDDPPGRVRAALLAVAEALPAKLTGIPASIAGVGEGKFRVSVPIDSPADEAATISLLINRAWYAAQRADLRLDAVERDPAQSVDLIAQRLPALIAWLGLSQEAIAAMGAQARLLEYAEGEVVEAAETVPDAVGFVSSGSLVLMVKTLDGREIPVGELGVADYIGGTALTLQRVIAAVVATTDTTIIAVPRETMNAVVRSNPRLARRMGEAIEMRRTAAANALADATAMPR